MFAKGRVFRLYKDRLNKYGVFQKASLPYYRLCILCVLKTNTLTVLKFIFCHLSRDRILRVSLSHKCSISFLFIWSRDDIKNKTSFNYVSLFISYHLLFVQPDVCEVVFSSLLCVLTGGRLQLFIRG